MYLHTDNNVIHSPSPIMAAEGETVVKKISIGYDDLASVLSYDADAGSFTWRVTVSPKAMAGSPAGVWLVAPNGKPYLSITYKGRKMSAAQVAWFLHHKEWSDRSIHYIDEDTRNLRIVNLKKADYKSIKFVDGEGTTRYKMHREQIRHYGLARFYNMTATQYADMFSAQNGRCAICECQETARVPGRKTEGSEVRVRELCVDHDHKTGATRQLLCNACNHMLGHAGEDVKTLRAAADYIERHRKGN